jgi:hypothetical protein
MSLRIPIFNLSLGLATAVWMTCWSFEAFSLICSKKPVLFGKVRPETIIEHGDDCRKAEPFHPLLCQCRHQLGS